MEGLALRRVPRARRWDAIVVGTGVGGSVAAAMLAARGQRVLVLEKNAEPGGILASHSREGFQLDAGSHLVSRGAKGPLGTVLRELGLARPRFLTHRIPVRSRGVFAAVAPATRWGLPRTAVEAMRALHLGPREAAHLARLLLQLFTLTEPELRAWDRRTLDEFIRRHTEHPAAYFLFSFLASIFFVLPPWQVSAGESIRCLRALLRDYSLSYVEGGMSALPRALLGVVERAGGEIVVGQRVVAIERRGELLRVSTVHGLDAEAGSVVCNLAPVDLLALVGADAMGERWADRARSIVPSGNAHQIKLALRRPLVEEGCVIGGLSASGMTVDDLSIELMERTVSSIAEGRVTDPMAVYAPVPTNYDASLAPPGCQLIVASIYGSVRSDPADNLDRWKESALQGLARVIPGLMDELLFLEWSPIPAIGAWMGKSSNAAICNGQLPGQVGRDRLPVETPVPGLFLCGDGAGGRGIGTELAAQSARQAAAAVLRASLH